MVSGRSLAVPTAIAYSAAEDAKGIAAARHRRGPGCRRLPTPSPRTPVVGRPLEFGQLSAPVGPIQLHPRPPRICVVRVTGFHGPTPVDGLAALVCGLDRGAVGGSRELGVRYSTVP